MIKTSFEANPDKKHGQDKGYLIVKNESKIKGQTQYIAS